MTLPTSDGLHYAGCLCNDPCTCYDIECYNDPCTCGDIECVHEQCICDRLSAAYQRGREDAADFARDEMKRHNDQGEWLSVKDKDVLAAARGESDHE